MCKLWIKGLKSSCHSGNVTSGSLDPSVLPNHVRPSVCRKREAGISGCYLGECPQWGFAELGCHACVHVLLKLAAAVACSLFGRLTVIRTFSVGEHAIFFGSIRGTVPLISFVSEIMALL